MPLVIKEFIEDSRFETEFFYIVLTYGCHHGGAAERVQAFLGSIGKKADYISTVLMLDNALPVYDMDEQRKLEPEKRVDKHLAAIKADIDGRKREIQVASQDEKNFYRFFVKMSEGNGGILVYPLYTVSNTCTGCGTCSKVCPMGCIFAVGGKPEYNYTNCVGCMACIHSCSQRAIRFATTQEVNPEHRYRNPGVTLNEIIAANHQR